VTYYNPSKSKKGDLKVLYSIQHGFIFRTSDFPVLLDAGIESSAVNSLAYFSNALCSGPRTPGEPESGMYSTLTIVI
jgi:hypothetical protein